MPADLQIALLLTVRSRKQSSSYGRKVVLQTIRLSPNLQESYVEVGGSARPGPVTINRGGRKASAEVKVHETRGLVGAWRLTFRNASTALTLVFYGDRGATRSNTMLRKPVVREAGRSWWKSPFWGDGMQFGWADATK